MVALAALAATCGWAYWQWQRVPGHWQANRQALEALSPNEAERLARDARNRMIRLITGAGSSGEPALEPGESRTLRLTTRQINAWLARELEPWLAHQGQAKPEAIGQTMVAIEDGQLILAAEHTGLMRGERERTGPAGHSDERPSTVYSFRFDIGIDEQGRARAALLETRAGDLPVPGGWVIEQMRGRVKKAEAGEAGQWLEAVLSGERFEPVWQLDDRQVRIVDFQARGKVVTLTLRHEACETSE